MTSEAFHTWSQHLGLSAETKALIASIRSSPPIRRVRGCAGNITEHHPSSKMGVSIQFEKGDRVKFPSHPKRTTTPNHGKRWVRRGNIWELAD
jgi:hypothetical protein